MVERRRTLLLAPLLLLAGCATVGGVDPLRVQVVDIQPTGGEELEMRLLCRLRIQNPNDTDITYDGIAVDMELRGTMVASGVSNAKGIIPRYGEVVVELPVSASALSLARAAINIYLGGDERIPYVLRGKVGGPLFSAVHFESKGELSLPAALMAPRR
jgi:LEA14-like dessication related protein